MATMILSRISNAPPAALTYRQKIRSYLYAFDTGAAAWLSMGFMVGMVSWHTPGIWLALSGPFFARDETPSIAVTVKTVPVRTAVTGQITTGSLAYFSPRADACIALMVDRTIGATKASACNSGVVPLRDAGQRRRGDRMMAIEDGLAPSAEPTARVQIPRKSVSASEFDLKLP